MTPEGSCAENRCQDSDLEEVAEQQKACCNEQDLVRPYEADERRDLNERRRNAEEKLRAMQPRNYDEEQMKRFQELERTQAYAAAPTSPKLLEIADTVRGLGYQIAQLRGMIEVLVAQSSESFAFRNPKPENVSRKKSQRKTGAKKIGRPRKNAKKK